MMGRVQTDTMGRIKIVVMGRVETTVMGGDWEGGAVAMGRAEIVVMQRVETGNGESRESHVRERYQLE